MMEVSGESESRTTKGGTPEVVLRRGVGGGVWVGVWIGVRRAARAAHWSARGRRGPWAMIGVWLIAGVFAIVLIGYLLANRTPGWFHAVDPTNRELRDVAQRLENRVITEAYRFRGGPRMVGSGESGAARRTGEDWTLRITEKEATAWLSVKLPEWLLNRDAPVKLPATVTDIQAHFDAGGSAWAAARVENSVVSVSTRFAIESGELWLSRARAGVGSLMLPAAWGVWGGWGLLGGDSVTGKDRAWIWRVLSGKLPLMKGAALKLEDGRSVRVLGVRVSEGVMVVECGTEVP